MPPQERFEVPPPPGVAEELEQSKTSFSDLAKEAVDYLNEPDVDDMALARMYIERGYSEDLSYWLVREAEVRRAPR